MKFGWAIVDQQTVTDLALDREWYWEGWGFHSRWFTVIFAARRWKRRFSPALY